MYCIGAPCRPLISMKINSYSSKARVSCLKTFRTRHEALQKLAIFFKHRKDEFGDIPDSGGTTPTKYSTVIPLPKPLLS